MELVGSTDMSNSKEAGAPFRGDTEVEMMVGDDFFTPRFLGFFKKKNENMPTLTWRIKTKHPRHQSPISF